MGGDGTTGPARRPRTVVPHPGRPELPAILDVSLFSPDGVATLTARGELDLATAPLLRRRLEEAVGTSRRVVADLRGVTFLDSTGLQVLLLADEASHEDGWTWTLLASDAVLRIVRLAGLEDRLPLAPAQSP